MKQSFDVSYSTAIIPFLEEQKICLFITTYQAGKLVIISSKDDQLLQTPITFKKPMGIAIDTNNNIFILVDNLIT